MWNLYKPVLQSHLGLFIHLYPIDHTAVFHIEQMHCKYKHDSSEHVFGGIPINECVNQKLRRDENEHSRSSRIVRSNHRMMTAKLLKLRCSGPQWLHSYPLRREWVISSQEWHSPADVNYIIQIMSLMISSSFSTKSLLNFSLVQAA